MTTITFNTKQQVGEQHSDFFNELPYSILLSFSRNLKSQYNGIEIRTDQKLNSSVFHTLTRQFVL